MAGLLNRIRLLLGLALAVLALNYVLAVHLLFPVGTTPMAFEFLEALHFSRLIYVAMGLMLVAGLALLVGRFAALALAAVMPVLVCMTYWAVVLEGSLPWSAVALALVAMAALLMLAHLHVYAAMLHTRPLAEGESEEERYERRYGWPVGTVIPRAFAVALIPVGLAVAFYQYFVPSMLAYACVAVLVWALGVLILRLMQGLLAKPERGE